jgi:hypothetical protein
MAVVFPEVTVRPRDGGISTVSSARRRLGIVGLSTLGSANQTLHTSDPEEVIDTFGAGELVEAALHVLRNSRKPVALDLARINPSIPGYALDVTTTRVGTSTGELTVTGAPNDSYEVVVEVTADTDDVANADGEFRYSLDGGDSYGNLTAIPANGTYEIPGTGLTLQFETGESYDDGDVFACNCVGPGFSSVDLAAALTALDADGQRYKTLFVFGTGANAAASAALAATVLAHAEEREAAKHFMWSICQAKHGLTNGTVTLGGTPVATVAITVTGTPVRPTYSFVVEITTTGGRGTGVFRWSSDGGTTWTADVTITAGTGINALGTTGVTVTFGDVSYTDGNEYTWAPREETDAEVDAAFQSVSGWRLGVCAGDVELESSLVRGRKNRRGLIYSALLKQAEDELHHDMGRVKNGVLRKVSALYRDENASPNLDGKKFITARTYEGNPGKFYITQGNTRAADGSVFDLSQYVDIVNEACRITQVFLNDYPGEDLRTNDDGTIADEDAEAIDDQLQALLDAGLTMPESVQRLSAKVRRDVSLAATRKLSAKVVMVPKFYVKQADADVGFAVSLTGE